MFTGIIEEIGTVRDLSPGRARLSVAARTVLGDIRHGCSIAVAGVCLTVVEHDGGGLPFHGEDVVTARPGGRPRPRGGPERRAGNRDGAA